jgi:hypothetical protein
MPLGRLQVESAAEFATMVRVVVSTRNYGTTLRLYGGDWQ